MDIQAPNLHWHGRRLALAFCSAVAFLQLCVAASTPALADDGPALALSSTPDVAKPEVKAPAKPASATRASEPATCPTPPAHCVERSLDDVWEVSSRELGCPDCEPQPPALRVWHYDTAAHFWNESSLAAFFAAQSPDKPDVIYVHGNRTYPDDAREEGFSVYRQLTAGVGGHPICFVIYSWPAVPIHGLVEDAREKAARTNIDGYYLGWLISQINHEVPVNLIGYSFGARIVTGALHILAGGSLFGHMLEKPAPKRHMQAVLVAAAVNNDWLAIGRPHGRALESVDRMLALNNGCDRALKHYGAIDPCSRPEALGYTGAVGPFDENGRKLREMEMCCAVGKDHNWRSYFYNPSIVATIRPYVGLAP